MSQKLHYVAFSTVSFININNLVDNYNHPFSHSIKVFIKDMRKMLLSLEKQLGSLEGANLEVVLKPDSSVLKEVKSFIAVYGSADIDSLSRL